VNTVSIWTFDSPDGAEAALRALERLQVRRLVAVDDVAVVVWRAGARRPDAYQAGTEAGAVLSGAFWGLLFGLLFLLPLTGPTPGQAVLANVGLPDELLAAVRERVTAGTSALFLLTDDGTVLDRLRTAFVHTDPLVHTLDREQEAVLRLAFSAD
jgi:uncharacterized membrane protein